MPADPALRFFVFTCRDPNSDFRLPLVQALRGRYETYYIWLRRRPVVSGPAEGDRPVEMSLLAFFSFMRRFKSDERTHVYFNSTNTYFPGLTVLLRLMARAGVWCLDMHDDLRYHNKGLKRVRENILIKLLTFCSDVIVHAAPTLTELFPRSKHLGNASHILPLPRDAAADHAVLIIASFDERFDFDFVAKLAVHCPELTFDLYGWTRHDDPQTQQRLSELPAQHQNIRYHGPYATADLPAILGRYRISVAPYQTDSALTRYIDPLRYYHCLNAGLEVVSTDIPQARYMGKWIHVADSPDACAERLNEILSGKLAKQPDYSPITWNHRAERLIDILRGLPELRSAKGHDTRALAGGQRPLA